MEKKIAGLLGAVASLGALGAAQAAPAPAPTDVLQASSYAELLEPITNARQSCRLWTRLRLLRCARTSNSRSSIITTIITITTTMATIAAMIVATVLPSSWCRAIGATITIITTTIITTASTGAITERPQAIYDAATGPCGPRCYFVGR